MWGYIKKIGEALLSALPVLLVLCAVVLYVVAYFLIAPDPLRTVVFSVASAILAGGVFAALLKSFQFIGVFRDAIADVMYRDPKFLERLHLPELMRGIISATMAQQFPELSRGMSKAVFSEYLDFARDYYYSDMRRRIVILSYDPATDIIQFKEEFGLTINADPNHEIPYKFELTGIHPPTIQEIPSTVTSLAIGNKSYTDKIQSKSVDGSYSIGYEVTLVGKSKYDVTRTMVRKHVLAADPFMKAVSQRFLDGAELTVENRAPDKIGHHLMGIGLEDNALVEDAGMMGGDTRRWTIDRLIFPRQGYILLFTKNA